MAFLSVAPSNTISKQHGAAIDDYTYPSSSRTGSSSPPIPSSRTSRSRSGPRSAPRTAASDHRLDRSLRPGRRGHPHNPLPSHTQQNELRRGWEFYAVRTTRENGQRHPRQLSEQVHPPDRDAPAGRTGPGRRHGRARPGTVRDHATGRRRGAREDRHQDVLPALPWWTVTAADLPEGTRRDDPCPAALARTQAAVARGHARVTVRARPLPDSRGAHRLLATWLLFLLREWPHRRELYGPDGPWSWTWPAADLDGNHAFTALMWSDSGLLVRDRLRPRPRLGALLLLGWRTRTMSVLFMLGVLSLQNRSIFVGDGGDNLIHLMSLYLVLTRCGQVWSLDARRAARRDDGRSPPRDTTGIVLWTVRVSPCGPGPSCHGAGLSPTADGPLPGSAGPRSCGGCGSSRRVVARAPLRTGGEPRTVLDMLANLRTTAPCVVIMGEVCLLYASAGWYKVQGRAGRTAPPSTTRCTWTTSPPGRRWPTLLAEQRHPGDAADLRHGRRAGRLPLHPPEPPGQERHAGAADAGTHRHRRRCSACPSSRSPTIAADAVFLPTAFLLWTGRKAVRARDRLAARAVRLPKQAREPRGAPLSQGRALSRERGTSDRARSTVDRGRGAPEEDEP